ncbi:hypothetical protein FQN51_006773 [Onygenales sp. PD_10]|nr:hypothetical protein FQN51_006773 [Onygenales sp. PD_10]
MTKADLRSNSRQASLASAMTQTLLKSAELQLLATAECRTGSKNAGFDTRIRGNIELLAILVQLIPLLRRSSNLPWASFGIYMILWNVIMQIPVVRFQYRKHQSGAGSDISICIIGAASIKLQNNAAQAFDKTPTDQLTSISTINRAWESRAAILSTRSP